jgi:hypothetical protein
MIISDFYKIESDFLNVTLFHRKPGKKSWRPLAYFSDPRNALEYLIKHEVMGTGMADFKKVMEKVNELFRLVNALQGLPQLLQSAPRITKGGARGKVEAVTA